MLPKESSEYISKVFSFSLQMKKKKIRKQIWK